LKPKLFLASQSLKRKEILQSLNIEFEIQTSPVTEITKGENPYNLVMTNAKLKAEKCVLLHPNDYVIGADTIVVSGDTFFFKPKNFQEGLAMLASYQKQKNFVYTGLALYDPIKKTIITEYESSQFFLNCFTNTEIKNLYCLIFSKDKSGGFSIEGIGAILIDRIKGSYYNILGLPLNLLYSMFKKINCDLFVFKKKISKN
jgi:septum formation protein